ncbi:MAG: PDZ domain-containing protein [Clostridia bacterium]|nr:PDZ domain-containing protein [Clostridia bacterium]
MFKKRISPFACAIIAVITAAATFVGVFSAVTVAYKRELNEVRANTSGTRVSEVFGDDAERYEKLAEIIGAVKEHFLFDYDVDSIWDAIYRASLDSLGDPYTYYMSPEELDDRNSGSGGDVGIGIRYVKDPDTGGMYVTDIIGGAPAEAAGIRRGDIIVSVNGIDASEAGVQSIVDFIAQSSDGDKTVAVILRDGERIEIELALAVLPNDNVYTYDIGGGTYLVAINGFNGSDMFDDFKAEMDKILAEGCERLIFDLRNNGGGRLDQVFKCLDMILPEGTVITYNDYSGKENKLVSDANCIDMPMAVLCNEGTASAAELFTAALKDFGAAVTVGTTTFGKGIMQFISTMKDGSGYSITASYYYPPSGENYNGKGITPDIEIELSKPHDPAYYRDMIANDEQLAAAYEALTGDPDDGPDDSDN